MGSTEQLHAVNGSGGMLQRLAETVGSSIHVQAVYGQPVERDGVTVIPVARMVYGFGGGGGKAASGDELGEGGGGGAQVRPVGFISVRGGSAEFRSIPDPSGEARRIFALVAGAGLGAWLVLRGIRSLFR
ncbi:MAG TPA: spore germination protein GerW family protein [Myxococcaceae bacterium]|nr:spore germination protein GerW family protein [Myxococcaceae bacterium]